MRYHLKMFIRWLLIKIRHRDDFPQAIITLLEFCTYFIIVSVFFTIGLKFTENLSWNEALWQVWQTSTTIGYGNQPAETLAGRIITMTFGLLAVAILGVVISSSIDLKLLLAEKRRLGMSKNPHKNGYVIFNYPGENMCLFIQEIISREPDVGICIVDSRLEQLPSAITNLHKNIHFIKGYSHEKSTYERAAIKENKKVVIFPVDVSSPESDLATSRLVDLVLRFVGEKTSVIYHLIDPRNKWMFNDNAIAILKNLEMLATVQECQDAHSSTIIQSILMNTEGANTQTVYPTIIIGYTWGEFVIKSITISKKLNIPFNPLALIHKKEIDACPDFSKVIDNETQLSVIAHNKFDWNAFEKELNELN